MSQKNWIGFFYGCLLTSLILNSQTDNEFFLSSIFSVFIISKLFDFYCVFCVLFIHKSYEVSIDSYL